VYNFLEINREGQKIFPFNIPMKNSPLDFDNTAWKFAILIKSFTQGLDLDNIPNLLLFIWHK